MINTKFIKVNEEISINNYYEKIKHIINKDNTHTLLSFVKTYGCQQNFSDGEKLSGMLQKMGYGITESIEKADIIVINTCAIRDHAEKKAIGNIGALKNLKKRNPNLIIAICGCMTEEKSVVEKFKTSYQFIDLVFGTHLVHKFPEILYKFLSNGKKIFANTEGDSKDVRIHENLPIKRQSKIKSFLPIMYGCDNFCSYCIVPYVRGRERSRKSEDILKETKNLIKSGYKEIMLLGQNVNSYGKNLEEKINFAELLQRIDSIDGEYKIRFMTSHPKDATKELIDVIAGSKHICHNFHLPFQSGNNRILKVMNRGYTREQYIDIINYAKGKISNLSLSSDVIVGFPGETEEEFEDTLLLIEKVEFTSLFTFIYSKRPGTSAALMPDPITRDKKVERLNRLLNLQQKISMNIYKNMLGKTFKCLIEGTGDFGAKLIARTDGNVTVAVDGKESDIGQFMNVEVMDIVKYTVMGKIL